MPRYTRNLLPAEQPFFFYFLYEYLLYVSTIIFYIVRYYVGTEITVAKRLKLSTDRGEKGKGCLQANVSGAFNYFIL